MTALHQLGAVRVRMGDVCVDFGAPGFSRESAEENAEAEAERRKREEDDELYRSAG